MKVIDLYNKIANGEELPNKFEFDNVIYYLQVSNHNECCYRNTENNDLFEEHFILEDLNKEIKIIEDTPKEDKKIELINENLDYLEDIPFSATLSKRFTHNELVIINKLNEIIDRLNGE